MGFTLISFKTLLSSLRTLVSPVVAFHFFPNQMSLNAEQEYTPSILTPVRERPINSNYTLRNMSFKMKK